jgi:DNA-binding SARP family transcriptional activator
MSGAGGLEIRLLGRLEVTRAGEVLSLPPSKKARALLGYLALTGRSHSRARLCELFWDVADDPRAGLRWCLSRLRGALDDGPRSVIAADRASVRFARDGVWIDALAAREPTRVAVETQTTASLEQPLGLFRGVLMEELDLPDLHAVQAASRAASWRHAG